MNWGINSMFPPLQKEFLYNFRKILITITYKEIYPYTDRLTKRWTPISLSSCLHPQCLYLKTPWQTVAGILLSIGNIKVKLIIKKNLYFYKECYQLFCSDCSLVFTALECADRLQ